MKREKGATRWMYVIPLLIIFIILLVIAIITQKQNGIYRADAYGEMGIELYLDISGEKCTVVATTTTIDGSKVKETMQGEIIIKDDIVEFTYDGETVKGTYDTNKNAITLNGIVFIKR